MQGEVHRSPADPQRGKGQYKRMTEAPTRRFQQLPSEGKTPIEMIEENAATRGEAEWSRAPKGHALGGTKGTTVVV